MIGRRKLSGSTWRVSLAALASVGTLLVSTLLVSVLTTSPASADTYEQIQPGYVGPIFGYDSRCLDDNNQVLSNYNPVILWQCTTAWNQQWEYTGSGIYLRGAGTGAGNYCLTAGGYTPGSPVFIYPCGYGGQAEVWKPQVGGALLNPYTNMCLDDPESSTTGAHLVVWTCNGGANQRFLQPG